MSLFHLIKSKHSVNDCKGSSNCSSLSNYAIGQVRLVEVLKFNKLLIMLISDKAIKRHCCIMTYIQVVTMRKERESETEKYD